jgi:hypothetical protein
VCVCVSYRWAPYSLKLEQRVNLTPISDAHHDAQRRAATFDGPDHFSEMRAIPGRDLQDNITEAISSIVDSVARQMPSKILRRGLFHFKLGKDGKLFFLWCSSLSLSARGEGVKKEGEQKQKHPHKHPSVFFRPLTPVSIGSQWFDAAVKRRAPGSPLQSALKASSRSPSDGAMVSVLDRECAVCRVAMKEEEKLPVRLTSVLRRVRYQPYVCGLQILPA